MSTTRVIVPGLIVLVLLVAGCGGQATVESTTDPAVVEPIKGTNTSRIVLTAEAAKRLGIETALARLGGSSGKATAIPYTAVLYDPNGATWTYTSPEPQVFVRKDITVDRVEGGLAILSEGPPVDTRVVTVGSQEIWGVEYGEIEED
jgi:hypothetical protein